MRAIGLTHTQKYEIKRREQKKMKQVETENEIVIH